MNKEEICSKVRTVVTDALALEEDEVLLKSRLITDLGADSLDFVDILFQVEKQIGVKIKPEELNFLRRLDFDSAEAVKDGFLTKETVDKLKAWLPALNDVLDPEKIEPSQLFPMVSVETLCLVVERELAAKNP